MDLEIYLIPSLGVLDLDLDLHLIGIDHQEVRT